MAETELTPEEAAADARIQLYNDGSYDAAGNPRGFADGGYLENQMLQARDVSVIGRLARRLAILMQSVAAAAIKVTGDNTALTAEDAENTRLDRIATAENVGLAAGEVGKAVAQADRSRDEANRAQGFANGLNLPSITVADALKFLRAKADRSGFELAEVDLYSAALMQRVARSANTQIVRANKGAFFDLSGTFVQTFAASAALGPGWFAWVRSNTGSITLDPNGGELIDGAATITVAKGEARLLMCTGAGFATLLVSDTRSRLIATTAVSSTVSAVVFTDLDVNEAMLDLRALRHNAGGSEQLIMDASRDNGATWLTIGNFGVMPASNAWNFGISFTGSLRLGAFAVVAVSGGGAAPWHSGASTSGASVAVALGDPVNAIRLRVASSGSFTAGTFRLIGRP